MDSKRNLALKYKEFYKNVQNIKFIDEPINANSNYWLNALILKDKNERNNFLETTNNNRVMTRPIWALMNKLGMFNNCYCSDLSNAEWLEGRVVNIPSSVKI